MLYSLVDSPPMYVTVIVDIFNFENILNVDVQCQFIFFCLSFFFNLNFHIISIFVHFIELSSWCDKFIRICFYIQRRNFRICSIYWCYSQTSFQWINNYFTFKKLILIKCFKFWMENPMIRSIILINIGFIWRSWMGFFLTILLLVLSH